MQRFKKILTALVLTVGLIAIYIPKTFASEAHETEYSDLRSLVDRAQSDLRVASDLAHGGKQTDRYHKAQDHLSKLDKSLSHGKYNKGALNDSIDEIKSILDHNTLQASARDTLIRDLSDLKIARDRH